MFMLGGGGGGEDPRGIDNIELRLAPGCNSFRDLKQVLILAQLVTVLLGLVDLCNVLSRHDEQICVVVGESRCLNEKQNVFWRADERSLDGGERPLYRHLPSWCPVRDLARSQPSLPRNST